MKIQSTLFAAIAAGSLLASGSLFAGDAASTSVDVRTANARASMSSTRLIEAPDKAARLVWQAPAAQRAEVAKAVIETTLKKHPTAVYATVKAVMTVAPEHAAAVMEGVVSANPASVRTALKAISEVNEEALVAAVQVVNDKAPAQAQVAQSFASRRLGNAKTAAPLFSTAGTTVVQQTTVSGTPTPRVSNDYPN